MTASNGNGDDSGEFPTEAQTSPGVLGRHPATEPASVRPDAPIEELVQQLLGGHTQLRGMVDTIARDVSTLMRESRQSTQTADERHANLSRAQKVQGAIVGALVFVGELLRLWLERGHL